MNYSLSHPPAKTRAPNLIPTFMAESATTKHENAGSAGILSVAFDAFS